MAKLIFYPLGNADSYLMDLDQKKLLFDFADMRDPADKSDCRANLPEEIRADIGWPANKELDVVAFTHLDNDHIKGSSTFFQFDHAKEYQGEDRVKIKELWVPAAAIVEEGPDEEARIIRQEARYRLKKGEGIRVFSTPAHLQKWMDKEKLKLADRESLISHAGDLVPGFSKDADGVEFFVHAPFSERDGSAELDRNEHSLVFQACFKTRTGDTRFLMAADTTAPVWDKIVDISKREKNEDRLIWDLFKIPHHCSYLSVGPEKGKEITTPTENVKALHAKGTKGAYIICTSFPIQDKDSDQPPHFQAKNAYLDAIKSTSGKFIVTMEHPNQVNPQRLVIEITAAGHSLVSKSALCGAALTSVAAARVG